MTGLFITFEGGEGAGKSTQIERLRGRLEANGHPVLVTREPGGSPRAERIRAFILAGGAKSHGPFVETLLFAAARVDHLDETIRPALAGGRIVLCDRFADSTRAYQGASSGLDPDVIDAIERVTVGGTRPDLTFILDLPAEAGLARAKRRRETRGDVADRFEAESLTFHETLREAFLAIARREPDRCVLVDGSGPADAVAETIWQSLEERFPRLADGLKDLRNAS
ncbi:MAG: dTMP kinase [Microvirga sp.]